jgi:hypothetical protein
LVAEHAEVFEAVDVDRAIEVLAGDQSLVELVIIAQAYPGQFSQAAIERLRQAAPLARWWGLLGAWCEGEARSGSPWLGVPRVYWHQFAARFEQELRRRSSDVPPHWSLPVTANEEDRMLLASREELCPGEGVVAIVASSSSVAHWISDACRKQGYTPLRCEAAAIAGRFRGLRAAIWDGDLDADVEQLRSLVVAIRPAPVVALLAFPRPEEVAACLAAGATAVLSKPLRMEELFARVSAACFAASEGVPEESVIGK